jgi:aspartyl-tRNA(Asn)/glutamyl-tRNA(Gln) amidotransferase subunit A
MSDIARERGDAPLWTLTAAQLAGGFREGIFTPVDVLAAIRDRHDETNPKINAVIAVDWVGANAAAAQSSARWRAGAPLSLLDGTPLTIKDNLYAAGLPATWGSAAYRDFIPPEDEPAIARLRKAGAIIVGKTNVPEFTLQGYTSNALFGTTRNPHALSRTPGGSTGGGAAAVAAGIGPIAIGTDGGGSLRRPAAHCGLFALKPSIGQIARSGGFPQILSDFEAIGPIARTVEDLLSAFSIMRGYDPHDSRSLAALAPRNDYPVAPRIGYFPRVGAAPVDPQIAKASDDFARALTASGAELELIASPFDLEAINAAWAMIASAGLAWHLRGLPHDPVSLGANAVAMAAVGAQCTAAEYIDALAATVDARVKAAALFDRFDILLCPATAALAWPAHEAFPPSIDGKPVGPRGHAIFTGWMNVAGLAAATIPIAMTNDAGGVGMQFVAATGRDMDLLCFLLTSPTIGALSPSGLSRGRLT